MILLEKLKKRISQNKLNKAILTRRRYKTNLKFIQYVHKKVLKHYKIKDTRVVLPQGRFLKRFFIKRMCEFSMCNHHVYRIPLDKRERMAILVKILKNLANLRVVEQSITNIIKENKIKNKYFYIIT